jgi:hypothetical protein
MPGPFDSLKRKREASEAAAGIIAGRQRVFDRLLSAESKRLDAQVRGLLIDFGDSLWGKKNYTYRHPSLDRWALHKDDWAFYIDLRSRPTQEEYLSGSGDQIVFCVKIISRHTLQTNDTSIDSLVAALVEAGEAGPHNTYV